MVPNGASMTPTFTTGVPSAEMLHIYNKHRNKYDSIGISGWILTAVRVCEDAIRCKMIFFSGGEGRFGLGEVQTWIQPLNICFTSREEPGSVFHCSLLISPRSITTRFACILCPCQLHYSAFGRGTSTELSGLLRKTGAKIPAGPFRYSDARQ